MSSRRHLRALVLAVCSLVATALSAGCGRDEEPAQRSAERPSQTAPITQTTPDTISTQDLTAPKPTKRKRSAKQRAAQRHHSARQRTSTATTPTSTQTTPATPPRTDTQRTSTPQPPTAHHRAPKKKTRPKPTGPPAHSITETASLNLVSKQGVKEYVYAGDVQGTLGGRMDLNTKLGGVGVESTFTVTLADGTLTGRGTATLALAKSQARFSGTATITGGTGAYAGARGTGLKFSGAVASDASTCNVAMSGQVRY